MSGINPNIICHQFMLCAKAKPVAQQERKMGKDRRKSIEQKIAKLRATNFIREISCTMIMRFCVMVALSNKTRANYSIVQLKVKSLKDTNNGKWQMHVDYSNLNKVCPKDSYPLPSIDRLLKGHRVFKFLASQTHTPAIIKSRCTH
ncbi:hypothetical protein CR513_12964, partial [Mucuna pruriens]